MGAVEVTSEVTLHSTASEVFIRTRYIHVHVETVFIVSSYIQYIVCMLKTCSHYTVFN